MLDIPLVWMCPCGVSMGSWTVLKPWGFPKVGLSSSSGAVAIAVALSWHEASLDDLRARGFEAKSLGRGHTPCFQLGLRKDIFDIASVEVSSIACARVDIECRWNDKKFQIWYGWVNTLPAGAV